MHYFRGPHPTGNVGVQINHIDPVKKGEVVWTINPQDVVVIGKIFEKGVFNPTRLVALTGSEVLKPRYYRTKLGASVKPLLKDNVKEGNNRYISGNVLTGSKISKEGFNVQVGSINCVYYCEYFKSFDRDNLILECGCEVH